MRVGCPCYATDQGIAHLALDFFRAGVVTDPLVFRYPRAARTDHPEWYPPGTPVVGSRAGSTSLQQVRNWMRRIDVMLCFESPLDWQLVAYARNRGVKTAVVTMYEWWPESPSARFDLYLCPSLLDLDVFTNGAPNRTPGFFNIGPNNCGDWATFLPVPAPAGAVWTRRTTARRFLHNAGHVGSRNHKGTDTLLRAMEFVESPLELTVRCQDPGLLLKLMDEAGQCAKIDPRIFYEPSVPRDRLFTPDHDVYVAPERYNGLSLPLQEAFAHGMPVVTTDRYPHNSWMPKAPLVAPAGYSRVRVAAGYLEIDEARVEPRALAAKLDELYGADVSAYSDAGRAWAEANSWAALGPKYRAALEGLLG